MTIRRLQERLKELGFYTGRIDGISGPLTKKAIRAAQRWHGLRVDGIAGVLTRAALWPVPMPQRDLDVPEPAPAVAGQWPRQKDVPNFYGKMGTLATIELPFDMRIAWDKRIHVRKFAIHEKCHASALRAFNIIAAKYTEKERADLGINLFGGCLNVRKMRGGSQWSMHSWAIAIDFDPARNPLNHGRDKARLAHSDAVPFWHAWESEGWVSLGRARNFDWMHVQAARL
jgi:hypothetical protein